MTPTPMTPVAAATRRPAPTRRPNDQTATPSPVRHDPHCFAGRWDRPKGSRDGLLRRRRRQCQKNATMLIHLVFVLNYAVALALLASSLVEEVSSSFAVAPMPMMRSTRMTISRSPYFLCSSVFCNDAGRRLASPSSRAAHTPPLSLPILSSPSFPQRAFGDDALRSRRRRRCSSSSILPLDASSRPLDGRDNDNDGALLFDDDDVFDDELRDDPSALPRRRRTMTTAASTAAAVGRDVQERHRRRVSAPPSPPPSSPRQRRDGRDRVDRDFASFDVECDVDDDAVHRVDDYGGGSDGDLDASVRSRRKSEEEEEEGNGADADVPQRRRHHRVPADDDGDNYYDDPSLSLTRRDRTSFDDERSKYHGNDDGEWASNVHSSNDDDRRSRPPSQQSEAGRCEEEEEEVEGGGGRYDYVRYRRDPTRSVSSSSSKASANDGNDRDSRTGRDDLYQRSSRRRRIDDYGFYDEDEEEGDDVNQRGRHRGYDDVYHNYDDYDDFDDDYEPQPPGRGSLEWERHPTTGSSILLPPPSIQRPTAIVHFIGGTLFGSYPQFCYGTFLERLVTQTNVAIVATPIAVDLKSNPLDHIKLGSTLLNMFDEVYRDVMVDEYGWDTVEGIPVVGLGHSLGARVLVVCESTPSLLSSSQSSERRRGRRTSWEEEEEYDGEEEGNHEWRRERRQRPLRRRRQRLRNPRDGNVLMGFNNWGAASAVPGVRALERTVRRNEWKGEEEGRGRGGDRDYYDDGQRDRRRGRSRDSNRRREARRRRYDDDDCYGDYYNDDDGIDLGDALAGLASSLASSADVVRSALTPSRHRLEFRPTPNALWKAVSSGRYAYASGGGGDGSSVVGRGSSPTTATSGSDKNVNGGGKTLVVQFDRDDIDQGSRLARCIMESAAVADASVPSSSSPISPENNHDAAAVSPPPPPPDVRFARLKGVHLTPVSPGRRSSSAASLLREAIGAANGRGGRPAPGRRRKRGTAEATMTTEPAKDDELDALVDTVARYVEDVIVGGVDANAANGTERQRKGET